MNIVLMTVVIGTVGVAAAVDLLAFAAWLQSRFR
jgi:hypothetical protein